MIDFPKRPTSFEAPALGVLARAVELALERREMTIEELEREIAPLIVGGGVAAEELAAVWASGLHFLATREIELAKRRRADASAAPRGSKKGQTPKAALGDHEKAVLAIERLRQLGSIRRRDLVRLEHHRYRGPVIARMLLVEAFRELPDYPEESAHWAELAGLAVGTDRRHYCQHDPEQAALGLRAELYRANLLRCRGEIDAADDYLARAIADAREAPLRDPTFWAEAKFFLASLRRAQRQFSEALGQAQLSAALWRVGRNASREVVCRWQIATIHEQLGEPAEALTAIRLASASARQLDDKTLRFGVEHAEVVALARCGLFEDAVTRLEILEPEYATRPSYTGPRLGVRALIEAGQGRLQEAQDHFRASRNAFLASRNAYDAALVTLDWSLFLLDQNRPDEVLPLALSMGQAFEALGVARETLASWAIFQTAAESRELSRAVAESLVRKLGEERAGAKPGR